MDIVGKIIWAGERRGGTSAKTGQPWASQDFTIEAKYSIPSGIITQYVVFNVRGVEKLKEYDLHVGDECTVSYSVNAHEYQGKWYNEVAANKVVKKASMQMQSQQQSAPTGAWQQTTPQQQVQQPQQQDFPPQQPTQYAQQYNPGRQAQAPQGGSGETSDLPF